MGSEPLRLGTRGSTLARRQATLVQEALEEHRYSVELVEISTEGDRITDEMIHRLGRTGAFVRELDQRVLAGEIDGAVHSLKDMPTEMPDGLIVAAVPHRSWPNDVLVTPAGAGLDDLPPEATIGTGSLRRRAQVLHQRPDLAVSPMRGNVDTRIELLLSQTLKDKHAALIEEEGEEAGEEWLEERTGIERAALDRDPETPYDALILAGAGLERAGLTRAVETTELSLDSFVPAPGQGAIALTMQDGGLAERVHRLLDHPPSRVAVTTERTILSALGGGCIAPIGVHAMVQGDVVRTRVQVLSTDGEEVIETTRDIPVERHSRAALELADELIAEGAAALIEAAIDAQSP